MKKKVGKLTNRSAFIRSILINISAAAFLFVTLGALYYLNKSADETVEVIRVRDSIYANQVITEENVEKYNMRKSEWNNNQDIILWENKDQCINKYATYFIRGKGYIFEDSYTDTKPAKNPWMSEVDKDKILITLPYNSKEAFGNILTPGDNVRIDIAYDGKEVTDYAEFANVESKAMQETLFDQIKVIDLLNNSGNSIYDYYYDLLQMSIAEREEVLKDTSFLSNVMPASMLLEVDDKQFAQFAKAKKLPGITYTIGLLYREEGSIILDQFKDISREISKSINDHELQTITNTNSNSGSAN